MQRLEIDTNIGRPDRSPLTDLNTRLGIRNIPVSPPIVAPPGLSLFHWIDKTR